MEDILASIRRIIADDTEVAKQEADEAAAAAATARAALPEPEAEDDVLDLADLASVFDRSAPEFHSEPLPDLTEIAFRDTPEPESPEPEPDVFVPPPPPPAPIAMAPKATVAAPPPPPPQSAPPASPSLESLVSQQTTASVSQAFNLLSHTILSQNAVTLEDMVREMLKPMLKVWLDDNLPPMVERLVRAEIERVARGSR